MSVPPMQPRPSRASPAPPAEPSERSQPPDRGRADRGVEAGRRDAGDHRETGRLERAASSGSLAWAGYAACAWLIAYAVIVRGYQGIGGTVGLAGTFEDPTAIRQASLVAGAFILLAGLGALALVRPWGSASPAGW